PTSGVLWRAPADGVITAWHVHGDTSGFGSLALRVLRSADGTHFTGVATSDPVTATTNDMSPAHTVSIPVLAGDYIGVDSVTPNILFATAQVYYTTPSGASTGVWTGGLPDGSTMAPSGTDANTRLMLNAVEALRPAVSGVSPSSGSTAGGQAVTISGSDL